MRKTTKFRMMARTLRHIQFVVIFSAASCCFTVASVQADDATAAALFREVQCSLAVVTTPHGVGSGFVLEMEGKKFLITNEHVTRGGLPLTIKMLNGRDVAFTSLRLSDDSDLAALLLADQSIPALQLNFNFDPRIARSGDAAPDGFDPRVDVQPSIGDEIGVFGNSDGGGVATALSGKVIGLGPGLVEIDAPFVSGNSGSPIVLKNGRVVGVATFATLSSNPKDWIKTGTRFNNVRRFGVRFDGVKWVNIGTNVNDYSVRAVALTDLETFCNDVYQLMFVDRNQNQFWKSGLPAYNPQNEKDRYKANFGLPELIGSFSVEFSKFIKVKSARDQYRDGAWSYQNPAGQNATQQRMAQNDRQISYMMAGKTAGEAKTAYDLMWSKFDRMCDQPSKWIAQNKWQTKRLENDAKFWVEILGTMRAETHQMSK